MNEIKRLAEIIYSIKIATSTEPLNSSGMLQAAIYAYDAAKNFYKYKPIDEDYKK